jgi:hypothetical protein
VTDSDGRVTEPDGKPVTKVESGKRCPVCGSAMDPGRAWWWTSVGSTCSEGCARDLGMAGVELPAADRDAEQIRDAVVRDVELGRAPVGDLALVDVELGRALTAARVAGIRAAVEARQALLDAGDCCCGSCVFEALGLPRTDGLGDD